MYKIDFKDKNHIYFVGIGGISMSGLAEILLSKGFHISGSDIKSSALTDRLMHMGAAISIGHRQENINGDIDLIVHTAAVHEDNPEILQGRELNIPIISRAILLGEIMKNYNSAIGISGTHGKTTTTSMISQILINGQKDPTVLVGGMLDSIDGNIRIGKSEYFLTEACEYTNSFLSFFPTIGVILNISADHMDFFNNLDEIRDSFKKYADLLPKEGCLVINSSIADVEFFIPTNGSKVYTFGLDPKKSDFSAINLISKGIEGTSFDLVHNKEVLGHVNLRVPGEHNVLNALAAVAVAHVTNIPIPLTIQTLENYNGCNRRFQVKGHLGDITIIDDYAHHPEEITATLSVIKEYKKGETWCVFQPHTYTRTKAFLKEFAKALTLADHVILTDIYAAREKNTLGIYSQDLLREVQNLGTDCIHFSSFDEIETYLLENCQAKDLLITMGAGDVVSIGEKLLGQN